MRMLFQTALISAMCFSGGVASAQVTGTANVSPVPNYHLLQVTVDAEASTLDAFKAKTDTIDSCNDASDLAKEIGGSVKRDRFVRATQLPKELRKTLENLPTGKASRVFTTNGRQMRILIICNRL